MSLIKIIKKKLFYVIFLSFISSTTAYAKEYKRIISLAPSITESLYELGMEQFVKGVTIYCPKGTIEKKIIGTLIEPDIEKIISLKPDIVISTKEGNNKLIVEKLKYLGFEVYVVNMTKNFDEICTNYVNLATKINKKKEAINIVKIANYSLKKNHNRYKNFNNLKIFWEVGENPLCTACGKSFINDYNYFTNTINIYGNVNKRYIFIDIENVIKHNPDIIFIMDVKTKNLTNICEKWNKYQMIKAVKNNKIFIINTDSIFAHTPLTFIKNVVMLTKIIYGEI
ncbi:MAG: helical backbone metal receptor [Endomicrobium sp.]|jgi:iron complex transport system substrate-binding protein|nr:helical backbone metal receptor [Endomicrobium sp.]